MSYTPELNRQHSGALRRIAWAINKPMTKTLSMIFENFRKSNANEWICESCKDKTFCKECVFNR